MGHSLTKFDTNMQRSWWMALREEWAELIKTVPQMLLFLSVLAC